MTTNELKAVLEGTRVDIQLMGIKSTTIVEYISVNIVNVSEFVPGFVRLQGSNIMHMVDTNFLFIDEVERFYLGNLFKTNSNHIVGISGFLHDTFVFGFIRRVGLIE